MNGPATPPVPPPPHATEAPPVRAPGRVGPRRLVAFAVAAVLLAGIVGLVVAALLASDDSPSSDHLRAPLDLDGPAVANPVAQSVPTATIGAGVVPRPPAPAAEGSSGDELGGDDGVAAVPLDSIVSPADDAELPPLASTAIELPEVIAAPPEISRPDAVAIGDLTPERIEGLDGWDVVDRRDDYVAFTDGSIVIEVFAVAAETQEGAGVVLTQFLDDRLSAAERVTVSEAAPQAAARPEFTSVAGAEYVAVAAGQQGTRTMSGAAIAAVGTPGSAVVVTTSHDGRASAPDLAADAERLQTVLAHVAIA